MESEDDDFAEMVAKVVLEFGRAVIRREATQRAIERVVERVGRFNGDKVPFYPGSLQRGNGSTRGRRGVEARILLSSCSCPDARGGEGAS